MTYHWFRIVNSSDNKSQEGLCLRLSGSGSNAVVLTKDPPKFLRASISLSSNGLITITSNSHPDRQWSLSCIRDATSSGAEGANEPMWHPVVIREEANQAEEDSIIVEDGLLSRSQGQTTFLVATWNIGHPQLFWPSTTFDKTKAPPYLSQVTVECYEMPQ